MLQIKVKWNADLLEKNSDTWMQLIRTNSFFTEETLYYFGFENKDIYKGTYVSFAVEIIHVSLLFQVSYNLIYFCM